MDESMIELLIWCLSLLVAAQMAWMLLNCFAIICRYSGHKLSPARMTRVGYREAVDFDVSRPAKPRLVYAFRQTGQEVRRHCSRCGHSFPIED